MDVRRLSPLLLLLLALWVAPAAHAAPILGIYAEDAADTDGGATALQARAGLGIVRQPWTWREIEPYPGAYDWRRTDAAVRAAASHGLAVLPFVVDAPGWASGVVAPAPGDAYPPRDPAAMTGFWRAAIARYGPGGTFWRSTPGMPIRAWQVWNEPNTPAFWPAGPDAGSYAELLTTSAAAIHAADPGATVVSAGMPDSDIGIRLAPYLRDLYATGATGFDALGVHAYAPDASSAVAVVARARAIARENADGARPIWITEFGYASAGEDSMVTTDEPGQARLLGQTAYALREIADPIGVQAVIAFRWRDANRPAHLRDLWPFHSGVLRTDGSPKPSLGALAAAFGAPLSGHGVGAAGHLSLRAKVLTTRRAAARRGVRLRLRCSRACRTGFVLLARQARPGRGPLRHVAGRFQRRLPGARARRLTLRPTARERAWLGAHPHASLTVIANAVTPSGAVASRELRVPR